MMEKIPKVGHEFSLFFGRAREDPQKRFLVPPPWVPHFWIFLWVLQDLTFKVTKKDQK